MKERLPRNYSMLTDWYELTMNEGYLKNNKSNAEVVFDVFFRKVPNNGGYAVMAGLDKIIEYINALHFNEEDIEVLRNNGLSDEDKLGVKYSDIAKYIEDKNSVPKEVADKIEKLHKNSLHKFNIPTYKK